MKGQQLAFFTLTFGNSIEQHVKKMQLNWFIKGRSRGGALESHD